MEQCLEQGKNSHPEKMDMKYIRDQNNQQSTEAVKNSEQHDDDDLTHHFYHD